MRSQFYCHIFLIKLAICDIQQDVENFNCISSNIFFYFLQHFLSGLTSWDQISNQQNEHIVHIAL
jgi:hypothetical protein